MLASFLKWMSDKDLVNLDNITNDNDDGFKARFKIQKCVFMAQHLGLETNFKYERYVYGPYSTKLTHEYYDLPADKIQKAGTGGLPEGRMEEWLNVMRHDKNWLEIATTLVHMCKDEPNADSLVSSVAWVKYPYTGQYISGVLSDLRKSPLKDAFAHL